MGKRSVFHIVFAPETVEHLDAIEAKHHRLIRAAIEDQLRHTPEVPTRNRKPLRLPARFGASWELRCGPQNRFRVFYSIATEARVVEVLAIGEKIGNHLRVGREEFEP